MLACVGVLLSACALQRGARNTSSGDDAAALKFLNGNAVNVGVFTADSKLCPAGKLFQRDGSGEHVDAYGSGAHVDAYFTRALVTKLQSANAYSTTAPITISGRLYSDDDADPSVVRLTTKASNGRMMSVSAKSSVPRPRSSDASQLGFDPCYYVSQVMTSVVEPLVSATLRSDEFRALMSP